MTNYLFHDEETGEDFFVQAEDSDSAYKIAKEYFTDPQYQLECDDYEAEMYGFDTY